MRPSTSGSSMNVVRASGTAEVLALSSSCAADEMDASARNVDASASFTCNMSTVYAQPPSRESEPVRPHPEHCADPERLQHADVEAQEQRRRDESDREPGDVHAPEVGQVIARDPEPALARIREQRVQREPDPEVEHDSDDR